MLSAREGKTLFLILAICGASLLINIPSGESQNDLDAIPLFDDVDDYFSPLINLGYKPINSTLSFDGANYHFNTTFGTYSWIQPLNIMAFAFRNGTELIDKSVFILQENHTGTWLPLLNFQDINIQTTNNSYDLAYKIRHKEKGQTYIIANVTLKMQFLLLELPKISLSMNLTDEWANLGFHHFRWLWDIIPSPQFRFWIDEKNKTSTLLPSTSQIQLGKHRKIAIGHDAIFNKTKGFFLRISWEDMNQSSIVYGGKETFWNSRGIVIIMPIDEMNIDPTTVLSNVTDSATKGAHQRKTWHVESLSLYWVFFYNDSQHRYYTSPSAIEGSWTEGLSSPIRAGTTGLEFSVWFDGTYFHYTVDLTTDIGYRMGTPQTNTSITWLNSEQTLGRTLQTDFPAISVDSDGYPWMGWQEYDSSINRHYAMISKSSTKDGTWNDASGFPYELEFSTVGYTFAVVPVPLTNTKVWGLFGQTDNRMQGKLWDGSTWSGIVDFSYLFISIVYPYCFSAVSIGDTIHVTFDAFSVYIMHSKRTLTLIMQKSPSDNEAVDGGWSNASDAYSSNNQYASTNVDGREHIYKNYTFDDIPSGSTIEAMEIGLEGYGDGNDKIDVYISGNAGSTWQHVENHKMPSSDDDSVYWAEVATPYPRNMLLDSVFRVKVILDTTGPAGTMNLDWIPVKITYTEGITTTKIADSGVFPVISKNKTSDDLYIFWGNFTNILYRKWNNATQVWETQASLVRETVRVNTLSSYYEDMNGEIAVIWVGQEDGTKILRHHYFPYVELEVTSIAILFIGLLFFASLIAIVLYQGLKRKRS